jgi:hypothetical protein
MQPIDAAILEIGFWLLDRNDIEEGDGAGEQDGAPEALGFNPAGLRGQLKPESEP